MVNFTGPRPVIVAPAPCNSPASMITSPAGLQRRETSVYSNCSAGTPVLYCTKAATPLAGAFWSEEPWSGNALNSDALAGVRSIEAAPMERLESSEGDESVASSAETAPFVAPMSPEAVAECADDCHDDTEHVSFVYRRNPYSSRAVRTEVFRCCCDGCLTGSSTNSPSSHGDSALNSPTVSATTPAAPAAACDDCDATYAMDYFVSNESIDAMSCPSEQHDAAPMHHTTSFESENPTAASSAYGYVDSRAGYHSHNQGSWTAACLSNEMDGAVPEPASAFVPPPPPPTVSSRVLVESLGSEEEAEAFFYGITMRWYSKLQTTQHHFVSEEDRCPAPDSETFTFAEWIDAIGAWWLRHFEFAQMKQPTQPTAPAAAAPRRGSAAAGPTPRGFFTHTAPQASHSRSAHIVPQHNNAMPAPRSSGAQRNQQHGIPFGGQRRSDAW